MNRTPISLLGAAALLAASCANRARLTPAADPNVTRRDQTAVTTTAGVQVMAQAGAWTGLPAIPRKLTPVWVEIVNNSGKPLRVRYSEFVLASADGDRYRALPPFEVGGTANAPFLVRGYTPVSPSPVHRSFWVAPWYGTLYPSLRPIDYPFAFDPIYYSTYYPHWTHYSAEVRLPTDEMLDKALPEGVVDSGGSVSGFLYFQKVDPQESSVTLRAELVNAREGEQFGLVTIPFDVTERYAAR